MTTRIRVCLKHGCSEAVEIESCWCFEHLRHCEGELDDGSYCDHGAHYCAAAVHYCSAHFYEADEA